MYYYYHTCIYNARTFGSGTESEALKIIMRKYHENVKSQRYIIV